MRALILRRVSLIQGGVGGPVLIGPSEFARRHPPAGLSDPQRLSASSARSGKGSRGRRTDRALFALACGLAAGGRSPTAPCFAIPAKSELARALGMIGGPAGDKIYDVAVVGCGPAGLATAVYAASEGLSVAVLTPALSADRPAPARASRIISAFPPGSRARRWPAAPSPRRRSSAPT